MIMHHTAAVANEHVQDLLREARQARLAAELRRAPRRTQRRRPLWWTRLVTTGGSLAAPSGA